MFYRSRRNATTAMDQLQWHLGNPPNPGDAASAAAVAFAFSVATAFAFFFAAAAAALRCIYYTFNDSDIGWAADSTWLSSARRNSRGGTSCY